MTKVDYKKAELKAYSVLLKYSDGTLPVNPFQLVSGIENIKLKTYRQFARELQEKAPELSCDEIISTFASDYGFLMKKGNKKYILCYNDLHSILSVRWTLFHELGHYFMEHLEESSFSSSLAACDGDLLYTSKEREANCFARFCSCPLPLFSYARTLIKCDVDNAFLFKSLFWVSQKSTMYTLDHYFKYQRYYGYKKTGRLFKHFEKAINKRVNDIQRQFGYGYKFY